MRNVSRFSLIFIAFVLLLLGQPYVTESTEQKEIRGHLLPLDKSSVVVAEKRFVDNGDGTVTDTRRKIMWQKGDNGKEVTFEEAQKYCMTLRVGGYTDWRLPNPDERDTALVVELMMRRHSRDVYAYFDLYWSSDPTVLLPFNYSPSQGREVSRVYPTPKKRAKGFVRAVRSLGTTKPESGS
jgi:hypothetical protein